MSTERAIFAGGCFWCMVEPFEERPGILAVTSGYTGVDDILQLAKKFLPLQSEQQLVYPKFQISLRQFYFFEQQFFVLQ